METTMWIMIITATISSFMSGRYLRKGETVQAIYYEIWSLGMLIMVLLAK